MFNAFKGPKTNAVKLIAQFVSIEDGKRYVMCTYSGLPAIRSSGCIKIGRIPVIDKDGGGHRCTECRNLRAAKGNSNLLPAITNWELKLSKCLERRHKKELCPSDIEDAVAFGRTNKPLLSSEGLRLREEAIAQAKYARTMALLSPKLKTEYKLAVLGSSPSPDTLFREAGELYKSNPKFRTSLVVALLSALVAKIKTGRNNVQMEQRLVNFYRYLTAYSPKAADMCAANLGGPSHRWMQCLNARDRKNTTCVYECSVDATAE